ncbi:hypothetical protein HID58_027097 [Brassica napus]|uniref:ABC transporter B family member 26, chloroplastic n=1 Tax=Brassica napus TaxID=3708 RepID=A0ABQ8CQS4_BRANA|nr:hypothetical protein HID58_027097 [Brassica napus]
MIESPRAICHAPAPLVADELGGGSPWAPPRVLGCTSRRPIHISLHRRCSIIATSDIKRKNLRFKPKQSFSLQFSIRNHRLSPVNCSTVNGAAVGSSEYYQGEGDSVSFPERIRHFVGFLRSILPGGSWWRFSEEVDSRFVAEPVTVWRALTRIWELVAEDRWVIFAAFSTLIVAALSEISIPHFLTASIFSAQSGDITVFHRNVKLLIVLCVTSGICSGIRGCFFGIANMILVKRMRETLYSTLLLQVVKDISFFDSQTVGDLTSRLGSDCQQVSRVIGNDLNMIFRNVLQVFFLSIIRYRGFSLFVDPVLAPWCLHIGDLLYFGSGYVCLRDVAQETYSLMRTVRVYGTEKQELKRYNHWLQKMADVSLRQSAAYGIWNWSFNTLYHATQIIAVLVGGVSILAGQITAEKLTKFLLYSEWLIYATWWVGDNLSNLMQSVGASEKVFQMMDLRPSDQFISKGTRLQRLTGHIEFVNVSFSYPSREEVAVLQNLSISVRPGEVVAIVGLSGSGKSTVVSLLLQLYEPKSGQILLDGVPLQDLDVKWLRQRIGYVGQEPKLFRTDIGSNIKYGCDRNVTQEDIVWAAKQAYAHDFITALPNGYNTIVDDDLLSGGQKQRIAIARAILRDPKILILDEATSALDAESEHNVKGVLRSIGSDTATKRSVIVIAHRLSTIKAADRIVAMDSGRVVEMGNHEELMSKDGLYARLTKRQADAVV